MAFNIKYIENNLVFNNDGECFAYYELIPYNYSFLSPDEKYQVHDNFRQLVAQSRDGKIHALQLATESSIRATQGRSKLEMKGRLKEVAHRKIDEQTEALVSMIGDNQVDYRFFIGFKLLLNEQELSIQSVSQEIKKAVHEFLNGVNHKLMGEFVSMSNAEIDRFSKMENLLESKISRRFKIRKLDKNDFGYIIGHIYGQTGTPYEENEYHLPKKYQDKEVLVKKYDILKPTRCLIDESQRYLKIIHEDITTYVAYFTINSIVGELDFPGSEIFYYQQQQFTFPIDTSMNVEIVANKKALTTVRNKKKELKDLDSHAWESDNETSNNVIDALDSVNELETTLDQSKESMYKLSYVVRVSAKDLDELKRRCDEVKDFYDDLSIKLVRPFGDMLGLHGEFIPASKRYINDYIQYVTSDFLAGLGFGATQTLGEHEGIYVGYNLDTGKNLYLKPALASQGVKGSVTNALASAFIGSLGGGKSFSNNMLVYYAVLFGGQAVIVDPKAERGKWKETLPEIAHEINIVNLTSDDENKGLLDPYVILSRKKDSESLAIDILTFLTGISSRDSDKFPVLRKAIRNVTQSEQRGLLLVIDELRNEDTSISNSIADHIESFVDYDFAHLLFSDGNVTQSISLEKQLNIIQVADLVLPDADTSFEEYTTMELLSVAMLIVISKPIMEHRRGYRTAKEAHEARTTALKKKQDLGVLANANMTYEMFMETYYIPEYKNSVEKSTWVSREGVLLELVANFGKYKPRDISSLQILDYKNSLLEKHSQNYARLKFGMFARTFKQAKKYGLLKENLFEVVGSISKEKVNVDFWTKAEFEKVIQTFDITDFYEHMCFVMVYLYYMTGLRVNEGTALWYSDIDFENKQIRVWHNLDYTNGKVWTRKTKMKTESGRRIISIDDDTIAILKAWQARQKEMGDYNFVLSYTGEPLGKSTINRIVKRHARLANVKEIQPKGLRHSHASLLINELNANPLAIQKRLGHSDIQITLGVYSHLYPTIDREIADQLSGKIQVKTSTERLTNWNGNQHFKKK